MTDEQIALSRRAVACKGWRWMPGMLAWRPDCPPVRLAAIEDAGNALQEYGWLPDLTDAATIGCLLALVRAALNVPTTHVIPSFGAWYIERAAQDDSDDNEWLHVDGAWGCGSAAIIKANTEAEALVAALEAAPSGC